MLKQRNYIKGKQILTVDKLISATSALWLKDKRCKSIEFCIDNPANNLYSVFEKDELQEWLKKILESYDVWERVPEIREVVFSEEIDNQLDDMLVNFAFSYSDSEYHQEEIMEIFLRDLKRKFNISLRKEDSDEDN